jgi:hypothetical protein
MVYKHRTKSGKIRHYQSRGHYLKSIRGMFANQNGYSKKITKTKPKQRMKHKGVGKVSSVKKKDCDYCKRENLPLTKGKCKDCAEALKDFYEGKGITRSKDELKEITKFASSSVRSYELEDITDISETKKTYNGHSVPKITVNFSDNTFVEYLLLKKNEIEEIVFDIWKKNIKEELVDNMDKPYHNVFNHEDYDAIDHQSMQEQIFQDEFDYVKDNLEDEGFSKDTSDETIWGAIYNKEHLFSDLTIHNYIQYLNFERLHDIRKAKYNYSYGQFAWDQDTLGVVFYDSPDKSYYLGMLD